MKKQSDPSSGTIIKDFFLKVYALKWLYALCFVLFVGLAFFFNRYSVKVYENNTTLTPVEDDRSSVLYSANYFQGLGGYSPGRPIENDITNIRSFSLVSATISSLSLEVGYFAEKEKLFRQKSDLYHQTPFYVSMDKSHVQPINAKFFIYMINDSVFRLTALEGKVDLYNYVDNAIVSSGHVLKVDTLCLFNKAIETGLFKFVVSFNRELSMSEIREKGPIYFVFHNLDYLAKQYLKILDVSPISPASSIINIKFRGENNSMVADFLNRFVEIYLNRSLDKKNQIAISTINFIDNQISNISDSLSIAESKLKTFKSVHQVTDLTLQGQRLYDQLSQIETTQSALKDQERFYTYILNYLRSNRDLSGFAPPSSASIADPIMNQLISELMSLNAQRASILSDKTEKSLFLSQIENKIKMQVSAITENVTNNLNTINLSLSELSYRHNKLSQEISNIPRTEMSMVGMQRKYTLGDEIYTYLLQKRSEAQITLASNSPDYELLEPARLVSSQIKKPREKINYLMAVFFALVLPTSLLIIRDFFKTTISTQHDAEVIAGQGVLCSIYSNTHKTEAVVAEFPESAIAESFRNLRSYLQIMLKEHDRAKVILITSSQPQDGKSFVSFNIASSIAAVGFKTLVMDVDLRRPTLSRKFKCDNSIGLTNLMADGKSLEDIKLKTFNEYLTFIPAGPMIPNPSELIEAGALDGVIETLKGQYDYIVLDTTPMGIVSEAITLMKYATQILVVARRDYTRKDIFAAAIENLKTHGIENYDIVFNDLNMKDSPYKQYNNYYRK